MSQISSFSSVSPGAPNDSLYLPPTHSFQLLVQEGDTVDNIIIKALPDFTAFIPTYSSDSGILSLNHELIDLAGVSQFTIAKNNGAWTIYDCDTVDFTTVVYTERPCSGGISPWNTVFIAEESIDTGDLNGDGYYDIGWLVEIDPVTHQVLDQDGDMVPDKLWAAGNMRHENVCFGSDTTLYFGADDLTYGYVYKFVPDTPGDLSTGDLFVLTTPLLEGPSAQWVQLPNSTPAERNRVQYVADSLGAANFNSVEDCEIGPDGKLYFTTKVSGRVYRLSPQGNSTNDLEVFVENQNYTVIDASGNSHTAYWNTGADNLAFDNSGNLWVLQDANNYYIWVVGPNHDSLNPDVRLFARTPSGGEPTGITFSPDYKTLFLSIMHPDTQNSNAQHDAFGNEVLLNRGTTIAISRTEDFNSVNESSTTTLDIQLINGTLLLDEEVRVLNVYSLDGKLVSSASFVSSHDLSNLNAGVYLIGIETKEGSRVSQSIVIP